MTDQHGTTQPHHEGPSHGHGQRQAHGQGHGHGHGHGGSAPDFAEAAELLDLDAEVFAGYLQDVVELVARATAARPVTRVADLGCGSGTGTLALAARFGDAELVPVDVSEALLAHLSGRARQRGVAERLRPICADLDEGWPVGLGGLDVVWAAVSLHHLADPRTGLRDVREALVPGGVLALVEIDDLSRFQPSFLRGVPGLLGGLEERVRAAVAPEMTAMMPFLGEDWGRLLSEAGFTVEIDRVFDLELLPPLPAATARYAALTLRRMRERLRDLGVDERLSAVDLAALDELAGEGPGAVQHRDDLVPRSSRHVWIARR